MGCNKKSILMVFDPPSHQITKTTVWASPRNPCASSDKLLLRLAFWGKNYEGFSPGKNVFGVFCCFVWGLLGVVGASCIWGVWRVAELTIPPPVPPAIPPTVPPPPQTACRSLPQCNNFSGHARGLFAALPTDLLGGAIKVVDWMVVFAWPSPASLLILLILILLPTRRRPIRCPPRHCWSCGGIFTLCREVFGACLGAEQPTKNPLWVGGAPGVPQSCPGCVPAQQ